MDGAQTLTEMNAIVFILSTSPSSSSTSRPCWPSVYGSDGTPKVAMTLFLAGRSLGWVAIGFSLFASNISSTTLIGLVGSAYDGGLYISNYEWMATIVLVFFVLFFVPIFLRSRISTIPEFLERRFGQKSRRYFSGTHHHHKHFGGYSRLLYAGAVVLQPLLSRPRHVDHLHCTRPHCGRLHGCRWFGCGGVYGRHSGRGAASGIVLDDLLCLCTSHDRLFMDGADRRHWRPLQILRIQPHTPSDF